MSKQLTAIEKDRLRKILADPVSWAKAFLQVTDGKTGKKVPWLAREYQAEMLRDESLRKVYRCGRRIGKCLPSWVQILDPNTGRLETVFDLLLKEKAAVATMTDDKRIVKKEDCPIFHNGIKEVFAVRLSNGSRVDATGNHPLLTQEGWKEIDDLTAGELVAVPSILPFFGKETRELELDLTTIPILLFQSTKETIVNYLNRLFLVLPHKKEEYNESYYVCETERFAQQIKHLLLRLGILSTVKLTDGLEAHLYVDLEESGGQLPDFTYEPDKVNGDIHWVSIESITSLGYHHTYDLTVPDTHCFIADDVVVHNTETMIVEGLHKAFTHTGGYRVLYVTPYETQVNLIFMRIRELIADSPLLKNEIVRMKSSPYMIEFKNGSVIMGFTTGASSGSGAASVRGQRADWIFLDELDK